MSIVPSSKNKSEQRPLGDLASFVNGCAFKPSDWEDSGLPIVRIQNLTGSQDKFNRTTRKVNKRYYIDDGDLLISWSASLGAYIWNGGKAVLNQHIFKAVPHEDVDKEYLYFVVQHVLDILKAKTHGSTMKHVKRGDFEGTLVPFPPLTEQRHIVDILKRTDSIRRLRKQAQDTARQLIPALFIEIFGDPAANPNCWIIKPLKEVADIGSGVTKGRKLDGHQTVELPYLAVSNVQDGYLNLTKIKSIQAKPAEIEKYQVLPGDFLMTEGGDPDKLGRGAIWNGEIDVCLHQNHVFKVRCNKEVLLPEYLRSLVGSHYGKGYFLRVAKQTTGIASINKTQLGNFPVLVPPVEEQNNFLVRLEGINSILRQQGEAQCGAESSFQSLLHRAFSGIL